METRHVCWFCCCRRAFCEMQETTNLKRSVVRNQKTFIFLCVQMDLEELCLPLSTYKPSTLFVLIKQDVNLSPRFLPLVGIACFRMVMDDDWPAGSGSAMYFHTSSDSLSLPSTICTCVTALPSKIPLINVQSRRGEQNGAMLWY